MKVYVVVRNNRVFNSAELITDIDVFRSEKEAKNCIRDSYEDDRNGISLHGDYDFWNTGYYIIYTDTDGEHEINVELFEKEI